MRLMSKLWQNIFLSSFLTITLCQVLTLGWYLLAYNQDLRVSSMVDFVSDISEKIKDLSEEDLAQYIDLYRIDYRRLWVEDMAGQVLLGEPWPGMRASERIPGRIEKSYVFGQRSALTLRQEEPSLVAICRVKRGGETVNLVYNWHRGPLVTYWGVFVQGALGLLGVCLFLTLWTSRRVSKPLTELRSQVVKIAEGDLSLRLEEKGVDEVADVAKAVNELTQSLASHIEGLKLLMANMSHETRSTVTNIALSLEIAQEEVQPFLAKEPDGQPKERLLRNLGQARLELDMLENMVAAGLLGGKFNFKPEEFESEPLDFSSLCRQVLDRNAQRASLKKIALLSEVDDNVWLLGDEILLDRLLANILDNALKYTAPGGEIKLSLTASSEFVTIFCLNTHPPLSDEELKSLFLPYYRVARETPGQGLGLYLTRQITGLHGGEVSVANTREGLLLTIVLPLPDEAARSQAF
ncbi:MAG: HAMP domain-containing histidine kinase [Deltaproteobacteria bacterium]|jgi:signal transduction histidine kinase|nr:HAMP domain-containing histidine kinase [Deltaproteobacteria bacterium]